jgi:hypothetical protein
MIAARSALVLSEADIQLSVDDRCRHTLPMGWTLDSSLSWI